MKRRWMLLRMIAASLGRRKSRVAIAFAAVAIGAAIVSALASVYLDMGLRMSRELRAYGANLALAPTSSEKPYIAIDDIARVAGKVDKDRLVGVVPYLYGIAQVQGRAVVVAGTAFDQAWRVNPYWKITPQGEEAGLGEGSALVGEIVATRLRIKPGDRIRLADAITSTSREVLAGGILTTGGAEENQVFVGLALAGELFQKPGVANAAFLSITGSLPDLERLAQEIEAEFPSIQASPIKRLSQSEGQVLGKIRSLAFLAVAVILLLTLLCVAITMMNMAMERRKEVGLRKALGAQKRDIVLEFLAEGSALGFLGGLVGWVLGFLFAQGIGQSVFHSSISLRGEVLPLTVFLSAGLAGLASFLPARAAAGVQPATILKGE